MTYFVYYYIFVLYSVVSCQQEDIILISDGCNPLQQDCNQTESACGDVPPPTMTLTCKQILENQLCAFTDIVDGNYCQASCGTCEQCSTTMLGCQCKKEWNYGQEKIEGCGNPDNDTFGSWCEIEPDSCIGLNNITYQVKNSLDYCSKECVQQYRIIPDAQNIRACKSAQAPSDLSFPGKKNVEITVVGERIVIITNYEQEAVQVLGWKILDGSYQAMEFKSSCSEYYNSTLGPLESVYLKYESWCGVRRLPQKQMRLVDDKERVISIVNTTQVDETLVSCYKDGKHAFVDSMDCQWL